MFFVQFAFCLAVALDASFVEKEAHQRTILVACTITVEMATQDQDSVSEDGHLHVAAVC